MSEKNRVGRSAFFFFFYIGNFDFCMGYFPTRNSAHPQPCPESRIPCDWDFITLLFVASTTVAVTSVLAVFMLEIKCENLCTPKHAWCLHIKYKFIPNNELQSIDHALYRGWLNLRSQVWWICSWCSLLLLLPQLACSILATLEW